MTTYELLRKLKDQLINKSNGVLSSEDLITPTELMSLRKAMIEIFRIKKDLPDLDFIIKSADFDSIYHFFYHHDRQYYPIEYVMDIIDPWLNELIENDFNITVERVQLSEKIETFYAAIIKDLDELERSYFELNYSHVTVLSSKILSSIFKQICAKQNIPFLNSDNHLDLYHKVKKSMNLDSKYYRENGKQNLAMFSTSVEQIIKHLNFIRNFYSDGHGYTEEMDIEIRNLRPHHFKLIVDVTKSISNFIVNSYVFQYEKTKEISF